MDQSSLTYRTQRSLYTRQNRPFRWSENKKRLLEFIGAFHFLTDKECLPYWGEKNERRIEKWLKSLYDAGFIDRVKVGLNDPIPHHLTKKGVRQTGFRRPKYIPQAVREHERFIAFIGITLAKLYDCTYPREPFGFLKPDATVDTRNYRIFIEADCHSESKEQWNEKLDRYLLASRSGQMGKDLTQIRVLVGVGYLQRKTDNQKRLDELVEWTARFARQNEPRFKNIFYFATEHEIQLNQFQVPEFKEVLPLLPDR